MDNTTTIPDAVRVDLGPVADACAILIVGTVLRDHVTVESDRHTVLYTADTTIPYDLWGSGAQGLWLLLASMASRSQTVSLYDVVGRLDDGNRMGVASALRAYLR